MKKIGLIAKVSNPDAVSLSSHVAEWLKDKGLEVYGDSELAKRIDTVKASTREELTDKVEALAVLGGDGTMLYAARLVGGKKIPILGANMGGLGFLTAIKVDEIFRNLERVIRDDFETEERMMLMVTITRGNRKFTECRVLNDCVIKGKKARLIKLAASINKEYVTTYRSDGIIVATPTGSTAYALSANGPILYPTIHSIIVVPICPFNLTNRPVVIPDWMEIELTVNEEMVDVDIAFDGQIDMPLKGGDTIGIKRAETSVYLIKCAGKSYFDILRERLMWESTKKE